MKCLKIIIFDYQQFRVKLLWFKPIVTLDSGLVYWVVSARIQNMHFKKDIKMKVVNSLKTLKKRDRNCKVIKRRGRVYVINKVNPRFKARQG